MATIEQGEASRSIEFTTIEKLFDEINCTTGDMLLVHRVSVQQLAEIEKATEERGRRFRFHYAPTKALIITIPTGIHERLHLELWDTIRDAIVYMGLRASCGQSDSSGGPKPERHYPGAWPTLVVEVGYSQTLQGLRNKMRWWFTASGHQVKIVLIAKLELRTREITIEKYIEAPAQSRPGATTTRAAAIRELEPTCTQAITITEDPTRPMSYNVTREALRLEFHLLFLRQPRQGEGDIVINTQELQEYAGEVWHMVV
ncbi:hypothetical protein AK830_g4047 [Neonectria ditissima]|uniref:Uncharacterized protein n=1 Tax=Neonectria ditissima TaxID=78410 RepID=A0A0P7BNW0_9HYPO|nr:hypothetical protein AK830_g4047 [Neonectria ditissima]